MDMKHGWSEVRALYEIAQFGVIFFIFWNWIRTPSPLAYALYLWECVRVQILKPQNTIGTNEVPVQLFDPIFKIVS